MAIHIGFGCYEMSVRLMQVSPSRIERAVNHLHEVVQHFPFKDFAQENESTGTRTCA